MEKITEGLLEGMNVGYIFHITIAGKEIWFSEATVVSWIVLLFLIILGGLLTMNLRVENPSKRQMFLESFFSWIYKLYYTNLGEAGKAYIPYLMCVLFYLGMSNIFGIFGFKPPTKDLNVTAGLAIMSIVLIEASGIRAKGGKKFLKSFAHPVAIVTPINIMEIGIRPLSLCMRLFGNVLGAFIIMELIELIIPVVVPVAFSLYFDFFDGFIQAYVFTFLTSLFIKETIE